MRFSQARLLRSCWMLLWGGVVLLACAPDAEPGPFAIAVLPDTQRYLRRGVPDFEEQTDWIARHAEDFGIRFVLHLGDIVDENTDEQWQRARRAMDRIDGVVPYALAVGNHDLGPPGGASDRSTLLNQYFPLRDFRGTPSFGGVYDAEPTLLNNSFHLLTGGGRRWLILSLEFGPRDEVVEWANRIVAAHSDRSVILLTHAYLSYDDTRYDHARKGPAQRWNPHHYALAELPGGANDGEELWQKLVSRHPNFAIVISGHVLGDGVGRLSSTTRYGNTVHQMAVNFQERLRDSGWMRLMRLEEDGTTLEVIDYCPAQDRFKLSSQHHFHLTLDPPPDSNPNLLVPDDGSPRKPLTPHP